METSGETSDARAMERAARVTRVAYAFSARQRGALDASLMSVFADLAE